ncbi:MAG: pyruvate:ferredoxin (flavodoxin) oxidoreductase [Bacillales bacterium]
MDKVKKKYVIMDGNKVAAYYSYYFTEVAAIYPITPSSPMADSVDVYSSLGKINFFNSTVKVCEMQSEGGAAGALHGILQAGSYGTTFTASQGLLLMLPNIYKWVGELLPAVIEVSARSIASRSLSIFGDHQDIYAIRQSGICMICSNSVQEVADLTPIAHLIAMKASYPVCHFFDGFRTSHEIQKIETIDIEEYRKLLPLKEIENFRKNALNPHGNPVARGGAENDDIYFTGLESQNIYVNNVLKIAKEYLKISSELTNRKYAPFVYIGSKNAKRVIVAMGSVCETIEEVVTDLNSKGEDVGLIKVILYRPFSVDDFVNVIPKSCETISVLDRTKEKGSLGEPLFLDVSPSLKLKNITNIKVVGGRYGLSSRDTQPKDIKSIFDWMKTKNIHHNFVITLNDDLTNLSIPLIDKDYYIKNEYRSCIFYGLGSDGTVSANKSSIKIIGEATSNFVQAYFAYDSRKAGGITRSFLRFGPNKIKSTYYIKKADFISVSLDTYLFKFDILKDIKRNGVFLLNTNIEKDKIEDFLPNKVKKQLAEKNIEFYIINANKIASELGMGRHTNTILQSAFFFLNSNLIPYEISNKLMKDFARETYSKKGEEVVNQNINAIDEAINSLVKIEVKTAWKEIPIYKKVSVNNDSYFVDFIDPINELNGYEIPTSVFLKHNLSNGNFHSNVTFKEKRAISSLVPKWNKENCIQCNNCAFVCPHGTIRSFLVTDDEINNGPDGLNDLVTENKIKTLSQYKYIIQVSPENCVGCGLCIKECLANKTAEKLNNNKFALEFADAKSQYPLEKYADYLYKNIEYKNVMPTNSVKGVSFLHPYHEVSGACQGCGQTPYIRLLSQLYGKDLMIANATGCSSIYNGSIPLSPFVKDKNNEGIAWANSLFEDNAEYGYGMRLATNYKLQQILQICNDVLSSNESIEEELKELLKKYVENIKDKEFVRSIYFDLIKLINFSENLKVKKLLEFKNDLIDKSIWIIGGDGFAYDIGYGGLDHVLASEDDVNIMVLDNEQYANTGGQASKSTQSGTIAQFASSGKKTKKKNLALLAMAYGDVYVAQIALGANPIKAIQAIKDAESYPGVSLIICYTPCINQGIRGGLINSIEQERKAVECGFFTTWRYDPRLIKEGKTPLQLDCKEPDFDKFNDFLLSENRFSQLSKVNPEEWESLFNKTKNDAIDRWEKVKKLGL